MIYLRNRTSRVNLFLIGEQKCGTSSLHELLTRNPRILSGDNKECQYFNTRKFDEDVNYANYHNMFHPSIFLKYSYKIDGTPDYLHDPAIAQKVFKYNPDSKLIVVLRDPVSRFVSAYNFYFSNILNNLERTFKRYFQYSENGRLIFNYLKSNGELSLKTFFEHELSGKSPINALQRGNYYTNIKAWTDLFGKGSLCILFFEYLKVRTTLRSELDHLESFLSLKIEGDFPKENVSVKKEKLDAILENDLYSYYMNETNKLGELANRPAPWLK